MAPQIVGELGRRAGDLGDEIEQPWIGKQHREDLHPRWKPGKEAVEMGEGRERVGGLGESLQERRHELGQELAGARAAGGANAAMMPAANDGRDVGGALEPHALQRRQRFGIFLDAGEDEAARSAGERRLALEQPRVMALDRDELGAQRFFEFMRVVKAGEAGHMVEAVGRLGKRVGLLVVDHLQAVFDGAQEAVGIRHVALRLAGNVAACVEGPRARRAWWDRAIPDRGHRGSIAASGRRIRSRGCRPVRA